MRPVLFLLLVIFSSSLFAYECNEIKVNNSTHEIIELQGLAGCKMRASLFIYGLSRNYSKEIYKNFYECEGHDVDVNVERFRKKETTHVVVSEVEIRGDLVNVEYKKNSISLNKFISRLEKRNQVNCDELTRFFPRTNEFYYQCGNSKLKIEATPYISCTDSWKSL